MLVFQNQIELSSGEFSYFQRTRPSGSGWQSLQIHGWQSPYPQQELRSGHKGAEPLDQETTVLTATGPGTSGFITCLHMWKAGMVMSVHDVVERGCLCRLRGDYQVNLIISSPVPMYACLVWAWPPILSSAKTTTKMWIIIHIYR